MLSYDSNTVDEADSAPVNEIYSAPVDEKQRNYDEDSHIFSRTLLGFATRFEYNFMKLNPPGNSPQYLMHGPGYGGFVYADFSLNNFIRTEGSLGFKRFSISTEGNNCGSREECSLKINYAVASGNLKLNMIKFDEHQIWGAFEGALIYPVTKSNKTPIKEKSFAGFHGNPWRGFGYRFYFRKSCYPCFFKSWFVYASYSDNNDRDCWIAIWAGLQALIYC